MREGDPPKPQDCNCLALREAARHVTGFYDRFMAPTGLRVTQFSILARLKRTGPMSINGLAAELVMDRTTLGRNILPLERDGLIAVAPAASDRRTKELRLTPAGIARLRAATECWRRAQTQFEAVYGGTRAADLRRLLRAVVANDLATPA